MRLIDSLPRALFPTRHRGLRWLKDKLQARGVTAPLSPGCLEDFLASADTAAAQAADPDVSYATRLQKELDSRVEFIHRWTTSDENLELSEWSEWTQVAQKHLLPRSRRITQTQVTESRHLESFRVPERLIVRAGSRRAPRALAAANDLPGAQILSDLKQANDRI